MSLERKMTEIEVMTPLQAIERLMQVGLIKSEMLCLSCGNLMFLKSSRDSADMYNWRCCNYACIKYQTTRSIRCESWILTIKITPKRLLKILLLWSIGKQQVDILNLVEVSKNTYLKLRNFILKAIKKYYFLNPIRLGGPGIGIQVDETMLNYKVKSHRGRGPRTQVWALGIVDTSYNSSRVYYEIIPNRNKITICNVINRIVRPGSIISTDEFASYRSLGDSGEYEHRTICHKYNFVCPTTGIHTQHIESNNNKLKRVIKKCNGLSDQGREAMLWEFMFYNHFKEDTYTLILSLLKYDFLNN